MGTKQHKPKKIFKKLLKIQTYPFSNAIENVRDSVFESQKPKYMSLCL